MGSRSLLLVGLLVVVGSMTVFAHEDMDLPAGPIRDRHELMENVGKNAKIIGAAMKAGELDKIAEPARKIEAAAKKIAGLFPPDSEHPKSRAKPEIWADPGGFAAEIQKLEQAAAALAKAADDRNSVPQAANELFGACKSCHTKFRVPED